MGIQIFNLNTLIDLKKDLQKRNWSTMAEKRPEETESSVKNPKAAKEDPDLLADLTQLLEEEGEEVGISCLGCQS